MPISLTTLGAVGVFLRDKHPPARPASYPGSTSCYMVMVIRRQDCTVSCKMCYGHRIRDIKKHWGPHYSSRDPMCLPRTGYTDINLTREIYVLWQHNEQIIPVGICWPHKGLSFLAFWEDSQQTSVMTKHTQDNSDLWEQLYHEEIFLAKNFQQALVLTLQRLRVELDLTKISHQKFVCFK